MKSRYLWIILGVLVVLGGGVAVGLYVEWDLTVMLLLVVAVLLALVLLLVLRLARASRGASAIEESIKVQASRQLKSTRPDQRGEVEELQRGLEEAIAMLKQSKLSRGRSGRQALYALPWYMIIGPPGAGKTTAVANSGLNFPVGAGRVRGVGGTRNCDWFFSDAAILLDTAGRYMTEQEDNDEWLAFLDTLKQHRRERPINGVLVGISVADLIQAEPDEILWHADNVRTRIDELVTRLGEQFPVYVVFMKCDLLQGFVEFFGQLSRREREQIWGCTFDADPDEQGDVQTTFEREFDQLIGVLVNLRISRLKRPMSREERQKIYAFPLQLASVKDRLSQFVGRLCRSNPYQEDPLFRGFYLTSGTQEGVPIDRVIDAVAREFDLPPEMHAPPPETLET